MTLRWKLEVEAVCRWRKGAWVTSSSCKLERPASFFGLGVVFPVFI